MEKPTLLDFLSKLYSTKPNSDNDLYNVEPKDFVHLCLCTYGDIKIKLSNMSYKKLDEYLDYIRKLKILCHSEKNCNIVRDKRIHIIRDMEKKFEIYMTIDEASNYCRLEGIDKAIESVQRLIINTMPLDANEYNKNDSYQRSGYPEYNLHLTYNDTISFNENNSYFNINTIKFLKFNTELLNCRTIISYINSPELEKLKGNENDSINNNVIEVICKQLDINFQTVMQISNKDIIRMYIRDVVPFLSSNLYMNITYMPYFDLLFNDKKNCIELDETTDWNKVKNIINMTKLLDPEYNFHNKKIYTIDEHRKLKLHHLILTNNSYVKKLYKEIKPGISYNKFSNDWHSYFANFEWLKTNFNIYESEHNLLIHMNKNKQGIFYVYMSKLLRAYIDKQPLSEIKIMPSHITVKTS